MAAGRHGKEGAEWTRVARNVPQSEYGFRSDAHRQDRSHGQESQRRIYTDGSMNPKKQNAKAGYGIAEYEVKADGREIWESRNVPAAQNVPRGDQAQQQRRGANRAASRGARGDRR